MGVLLDQINRENDIKKIPPEYWDRLAEEIREFLVEHISRTGGHLGSNLGAVELTMALHLMLDLPEDRIIWDVGHQSYTHKLLTGRKDEFGGLRSYGGISGFPLRSESPCDAFGAGHSSTSISAALGMVHARELTGGSETIVAVIGDGSITGGMAYEALNNASKLSSNLIIVLNDNNMSISENVGGISNYLNDIRTSDGYIHLRDKIYYSLNDNLPKVVQGIRKTKNSIKQVMIPGMYFEELGITYLGPVDGHDVRAILRALQNARHVNKAVVVHVNTKKGKGYPPAERHPARFHGTGAFDIATGMPLHPKKKASWTDIFSTVMVKLAQRDPQVTAVTAAMADGVGLKRFRSICPERFFDVGIAEQHAVTFAAGLAAGGMKPVVAIYSTFLQRAYDQILHDVCLQGLHVVFAVDRAGIVGEDGATHQGIFDLSYLTSIPGLTVMAPKNKWELSDMMKFALAMDGPAAVRYPRGEAYDGLKEHRARIELGRAEVICKESGVLLFAIGSMVRTAAEVHGLLADAGIASTVVNARFAHPLDETLIESLIPDHSIIVTMEENVLSGGLSEHVSAFLERIHADIRQVAAAVPDRFVEHGSPAVLRAKLGLDAESIARRVMEELEDAG